MTTAELFIAMLMGASSMLELWFDLGYRVNFIVVDSMCFCLAIALGLALKRLHNLQKKLSGIFSNQQLMVTHWAAFVAAIVFFTIQYTVFAIHGTLQEDIHQAA